MGRRIGLTLAMVGLTLGIANAKPALSTKDFGDLKKKAQRAMKTGEWGTLAARAADIGRDDSKRAVDFLTNLAKVPQPQVYNAARDAVAGMRSDEAQQEIISKLEKGNGLAGKMLLVDAMAKRGDTFAGEALGAACGAKQSSVQRAAVSAIKKGKLLSAVDGLIDLLERLEKREPNGLNIALVQETLNKLTKESYEKAEDWRKFWEPRKQSFRPQTGPPTRSKDGTARRKRPTFFGSEIKSNRLVFVIDMSGSMEAADGQAGPAGTGGHGGGGGMPPMGGGGGMPPGGGGAGGMPPAGGGGAAAPNSRVRIERAKQQLIQVVEMLPKDAKFTIMAYSGVLLVGPGGPVKPPGTEKDGRLPPKIQEFEWLKIWQPKLMAANKKSKDSAKAFVQALQANGSTFTLNALRHAMKVKGADTIVLLSDGAPSEVDYNTGQQLTTDKILDEVALINRMERRVIDTFGFDAGGGGAKRGRPGGFRRGGGGSKPAGFGGRRGGGGGPAGGFGGFMQDLAGQNGGNYTQIK